MRMRVAASAAVTALVAGALSGCMLITPQQTSRSYTPSDGVNGSVGDVQIRNVLLISSGDEVANMLGVLANSGDSPATVTLQYATTAGTETTELTVPANGVLSLRPNTTAQGSTQLTTEARDVRLNDVDTTPGGLFSVGFSTGAGDPVALSVPVLNGTLSEYASLVPTPTASAASDVPSESASASTGAPSESPSETATAG